MPAERLAHNARRDLQRNRVGAKTTGEIAAEDLLGPDVHRDTKELGELDLQRLHVEQRASGLELDEQVDVAVGPVLASGGGTEDARFGGAVPLTRRKHLAAPTLEDLPPRPRERATVLSSSRMPRAATRRSRVSKPGST